MTEKDRVRLRKNGCGLGIASRSSKVRENNYNDSSFNNNGVKLFHTVRMILIGVVQEWQHHEFET